MILIHNTKYTVTHPLPPAVSGLPARPVCARLTHARR